MTGKISERRELCREKESRGDRAERAGTGHCGGPGQAPLKAIAECRPAHHIRNVRLGDELLEKSGQKNPRTHRGLGTLCVPTRQSVKTSWCRGHQAETSQGFCFSAEAAPALG